MYPIIHCFLLPAYLTHRNYKKIMILVPLLSRIQKAIGFFQIMCVFHNILYQIYGLVKSNNQNRDNFIYLSHLFPHL